jgi:hypothetical protein
MICATSPSALMNPSLLSYEHEASTKIGKIITCAFFVESNPPDRAFMYGGDFEDSLNIIRSVLESTGWNMGYISIEPLIREQAMMFWEGWKLEFQMWSLSGEK